MVVDHSKPSPVRARAVDPPIRIATIDLAVLMSVEDDVLDLKPAQASIAQAKLSMVGPNKVLDFHGARAYASAPGILCRSIWVGTHMRYPRVRMGRIGTRASRRK